MNVRYIYLILAVIFLFACQDEERFIGKESKIDFSYAINQETQTVVFTNESTDNFSNFLWRFGDSNTSDSKNSTHTYQTEGEYTVILKAYNEYAEGYQLVSKNIEISTSSTDALKVEFEQATNVDYAGFDVEWSIQNLPSDATLKILLSTNDTFNPILQLIPIEVGKTSHIFTNLKPKQTYYYKVLVEYDENNVTLTYESDVKQVTLTNFFIPNTSLILQRNADDLDVMYFRAVVNDYFSNHVVDIESTNIPYSENVIVSVDGGELVNPVEGLKYTYLKQPYSLYTVKLNIMYSDSSDHISEALIIGDHFLVKREDNTLWKGSITQKKLNNNYTELILGNSNGEKLVFKLTNYSEKEGQEYVLSIDNASNNTVYYMDGINNDKYYLQSENLTLKCTHSTDKSIYYNVLDQSNHLIDMFFQQDSSLNAPQSVRFGAVSFIIQ